MNCLGKAGSALLLAATILQEPTQSAAAELPFPGLEDLKLPPLKRFVPTKAPDRSKVDPILVERYGKRQFTSGVNTGILIGIGLGVGAMTLLNELKKGAKRAASDMPEASKDRRG